MPEPDNLVLQFLRDMRGEMKDMRGDMATKGDVARVDKKIDDLGADLRSEMH